ncbi:FAD/NAD(P)-binding protein [Stenotrophomonas sp. CFBP 13725]|uniref:FAD/NAD(P)-binding protein n=1 Tax=Stenotrophomonas sp. CFBP 13725 TaxID=2775297 RepID=UPI00178093E4|nr:FAD/NAD(P)-binding protein [Stenotrophomonas sp. CFBP 13725]MBD8637372.1 FAD/NAD(P)-binding protein [Stenotrophomonas sp. CFBP 13725]
MNDQAHPHRIDLAIIGGGAAGVMVALQALRHARHPLQLQLFEPASTLAEGIAYATRVPQHLLNVPAGRMSALPDQPADFIAYLRAVAAYPQDDDATLATRFVSRHHYAAYLRQRLSEAQQTSVAQLAVVQQPILALRRADDGLQLQFGDGRTASARQVVLACGNSVRPMPVAGADALPHEQVAEAWDYDGVRLLAGDDAIGIIGSGLSMVDSVLALSAAGQTGVIHVFSRHGLLPLPHAHGAPAEFDPQPLLALSLRGRMRALRQHARDAAARGIPWQSVMERIRPLGQALWQSLDAADQRRFLRHVARQWDVHRHRIDPDVHAHLRDAMRDGRLQQHRARLQGVVETEDGLQLAAHSAQDTLRHWHLGALVNATGVETRAGGLRNPLLRQLLAEGLARPGPHGLGVDSAPQGDRLLDADGTAHADIAVLGSLRIGTLWESLAVPELRQQAQNAARHAVQELEAAMP